MYTLYKFHFLNGISEINQLFDDILIIYQHLYVCVYIYIYVFEPSVWPKLQGTFRWKSSYSEPKKSSVFVG